MPSTAALNNVAVRCGLLSRKNQINEPKQGSLDAW